MDEAIIPECYVDTCLLETLVPPLKHYNHQKGCGTVMKVMKEKFSDRFAVGIIDKDKHQVDYLLEFDELIEHRMLVLHKHRVRHHYVIQISPAIERFILQCAQNAGISLQKFDLPDEFNLLKKTTKTVSSKRDLRFKDLFKTLMEKSEPQILLLQKWVHYLRQEKYNASPGVFKNM